MKTPAAVSRRQSLAAKKAWKTRRANVSSNASRKAWATRRELALLLSLMLGAK